MHPLNLTPFFCSKTYLPFAANKKNNLHLSTHNDMHQVKRWFPLLIGVLIFLSPVSAQEIRLNYSINRHGKAIGSLRFKQTKSGTNTAYVIESDVKVSMIVSIHVQAKEQSVYESEVLKSSSLYRQVNGSEKTNKQIKNNGTGLTVTEDGEEVILKNYVVKYNTHCLYIIEPTYYLNVFSDKYQQFIPIQKISDHHYKLNFPDGNSNEYIYENGSCKLIKVRTSLFDADFVLMN